MTNPMLHLKNSFSSLEVRLKRLNELVNAHLPEIKLYRTVTIPVKFDHAPRCFDHIISWSYSLVFESLSKHYDFLIRQAKKLNPDLSSNVMEFKQSVHYHRTYQQHSQFDIDRFEQFSNYVYAWFQNHCGKKEPSSELEWIYCIERLLEGLLGVISCFEVTIKQGIGSEFSHVFFEEWSKLALRTFEKHEYNRVLARVLEDHGLSTKIDSQLFTNKYLNNWQRSVEILPDGFNFEKEVYSIIQHSIMLGEVIPIDGSILIKAGIPQGSVLRESILEARRSFYANPCSPEVLVNRTVSWYNEIYMDPENKSAP